MVKYATAGLDPNIFVQKYMIELPSEEEIKSFIVFFESLKFILISQNQLE